MLQFQGFRDRLYWLHLLILRDKLPQLQPVLKVIPAIELHEQLPSIATQLLSPTAVARFVDFTIAIISAEIGIQFVRVSAKDYLWPTQGHPDFVHQYFKQHPSITIARSFVRTVGSDFQG